MASSQHAVSLSEAARACQAGFEECRLQAIAFRKADDDLSLVLWIEARQQDFNLWVTVLKATGVSSSSLDRLLEHRPALRYVLANGLRVLQELQARWAFLATGAQPEPGTTQEELANSGSESGTSGSDSGDSKLSAWSEVPSEEGPKQEEDTALLDTLQHNPKLYARCVEMKARMSQLLRLATAIRHAGTAFRHERADNRLARHPGLYNDLRQYLCMLVIIKHPVLRQEYLRIFHPNAVERLQDGEDTASHKRRTSWLPSIQHTLSQGIAYLFKPRSTGSGQRQGPYSPTLSLIQLRLIQANIIRRNRFEDAKGRRPSEPPKASAPEPPEPPRPPFAPPTSRTRSAGLVDAKGSAPQAKENAPRHDEIPSTVVSTQLDPRIPDDTILHRKPSSVATLAFKSVQYPRPPKLEGNRGAFSCPLCCSSLDASYAKKDSRGDYPRWRSHLSSDIAPYVCVFNPCERPLRLYVSKREWMEHMNAEHSISVWQCKNCPVDHDTPMTQATWIKHMQLFHHLEVPDIADLELLSEVGRVNKLCISSCPICGLEDLGPDPLQDHVAQHLQEFALESLPEDLADLVMETESILSRHPSAGSTRDLHSTSGSSQSRQERAAAGVPLVTESQKKLTIEALTKLTSTIFRESKGSIRSWVSDIEPDIAPIEAASPRLDAYDYQEEEARLIGSNAAHKVSVKRDAMPSSTSRPKKSRAGQQDDRKRDQLEVFTSTPSTASYQAQHASAPSAVIGQFEADTESSAGPQPEGHQFDVYPSQDTAGYSNEPSFTVRDPRYRRARADRFQPGEIFKVGWAEPKGISRSILSGLNDHQEIEDSRGVTFLTGFRKFLIVANDYDHCTCVPILTYGGKACTGKGAHPESHGIVYSRGNRPKLLDGEPKLGFQPIRVDIYQEGEMISSKARVNYSKMNSVSHDVEVFFIGCVAVNDWPIVSDAVNSCWNQKDHHPWRRAKSNKS